MAQEWGLGSGRWAGHGPRGPRPVGDERDELIIGSNRADRLDGRGGDDVLWGRGGDDRLDGGAGADDLFGGSGRDTLVADRDDDTLDGGRGRDTVTLEGDGAFDFRGDLVNVERVAQGRGDATLVVDSDFFLTADAPRLVVDLGRGDNDTLDVRYDPARLDIDRQPDGDLVFGPTGGAQDRELVLVGVEHFTINGTNYDPWIA